MPFNVYNNPKRGLGSPRGRGIGRGDEIDPRSATSGRGRDLTSRLHAGVPLSKLLYEDRPFLKPIKFVRSVYTATLFQKEDDIFQPVVESAGTSFATLFHDRSSQPLTVEGDEKSHVPTADAVLRVFNTDKQTNVLDGEEELEEVDFTDIGRVQAEVDAAASQPPVLSPEAPATEEMPASFFVDTTPSTVIHTTNSKTIQVDRLNGALGDATTNNEDDDEVIVYVAPHPRITNKPTTSPVTTVPMIKPLQTTSILTGVTIGSSVVEADSPPPLADVSAASKRMDATTPLPNAAQPALTIELGTLYPETTVTSHQSAPEALSLPPPPSFDDVSFSFTKSTATGSATRSQKRRLHPVGTPRSLIKRKPRRRSLGGFGAFGAMHEEALLHEEDPRRAEQRRGDSDINWGTSDEDDDVDALSADMGGMEIDGEIDLQAMKRFVHSLSAEGSKHVTMDDIADTERMRKEDEDTDVRGPESDEDGTTDIENPLPGYGAKEKRSEDNVDSDEDDEGDEDEDDGDGNEEVEKAVRAEEEFLIGEDRADLLDHPSDSSDNDEDGEEDDSEDDGDTPRRSFQAKLERLREGTSSKGKGKGRATGDSSDEAMSVQMTWADDDEEYLAQIQVRGRVDLSIVVSSQ